MLARLKSKTFNCRRFGMELSLMKNSPIIPESSALANTFPVLLAMVWWFSVQKSEKWNLQMSASKMVRQQLHWDHRNLCQIWQREQKSPSEQIIGNHAVGDEKVLTTNIQWQHWTESSSCKQCNQLVTLVTRTELFLKPSNKGQLEGAMLMIIWCVEVSKGNSKIFCRVIKKSFQNRITRESRLWAE